MKTYGAVLVVVFATWLDSVYIIYLVAPFRLFLFVFFGGASVYAVDGLLAVVWYKPPGIVFRFPRLYVSIISYLCSVGAFTYWYAIGGVDVDILFYVGVVLSFLGTMGLTRGFRRIPTLAEPSNASRLSFQHSKDILTTTVEGRWYNPGLQGRHVVKFERGWCFLEETGKRITWIKPRQVFRAGIVTVIVDTGFWRYGRLTLRFDSSLDADTAEDGLRRIMH